MPAPLTDFVPARSHLRQTLALALPVVIVQVGIMAMGVTDTIMVGHLSGTALAAVALGNLFFFAITILGMGVLMALDPLVAQAMGARDHDGAARAIQRGLILSTLISLPISLLLITAGPVLNALRQPAEIVPLAAAFVRISVPGVLPLLAFVVFRQSLQAMHRMSPIVVTIVAGNLLNVGLNWVLIFGHLGLPALGVVGSAWSTSVSRWLMASGLLVVAWRELRPYLIPVRREVLDRAALVHMLRLGLPIGGQMQLEYSAFGVIGLLMGSLGTRTLAAHQIALNLASLTFMVPLGVSGAAAVLVGHAVGEGNTGEVRRMAGAALAWGVGFMCLSAVAFIGFPRILASAYSTDDAVIALAAVLIPIAGIFQVFDGIQVVALGILRGAADTRAPVVANVLGFWLMGMPVSLYLGFRTSLGPRGLWWGLVAGLAAVALFLVLRIRWRFSREIRRVLIGKEGIGLTPVPPNGPSDNPCSSSHSSR